MSISPDPLETRLRASAPMVTIEDAAELSAVLAAAVVHAHRQQRARWLSSKRWRVAVVGAVLVLAPGVAVAAQQFAARTGIFGHTGMTEEDTSEWINVCSTDFDRLVLSLPRPAGALPAGSTGENIAREVISRNINGVGQGCHGQAAMVQESGLRADFSFVAQMRWECKAVAEHDAGRELQARAAAGEMAATYDRLAAAGRFGDKNWKPQRDAALRGDFTSLRQNINVQFPSGYCAAREGVQ